MSENERTFVAIRQADKPRFDKLADGRTQPAMMSRLLDTWENAATVANIVELLRSLTDDERFEVFGNFCKYCGDDNPRCKCWNDV